MKIDIYTIKRNRPFIFVGLLAIGIWMATGHFSTALIAFSVISLLICPLTY